MLPAVVRMRQLRWGCARSISAARRLGTGISYGLGRLSNAAGPLIVAALHQSNGYRSVFYFIAGTRLAGAVVLAVLGPRTRQARMATQVEKRETVEAS